MRDFRLFSFAVAVLGLTVAGCAGAPTNGDVAMGPAGTAGGEPGAMAKLANQELPGMAPAGEPAAAAHPAAHPAAQAILQMAQEAMGVLGDPSMSPDQREQKLRRLMARDIDIQPIARFVLGRYWRAATEQQREAYMAAYADYILSAYTTQISGGGSSVKGFDVVKTQPHGRKDFLVHCVVSRANAKPIHAVWRVRRHDNGYRIIDLIVEGVSMVQTQRQEFVSMIRANGGDVDKLIETLRERTI